MAAICPGCGGAKANRKATHCWDCFKLSRAAACSVGQCDRPASAHGLCAPHRRRQLKGRPIDTPIRDRVPGLSCDVEGCERNRVGGGLCRLHYTRVWRGGEVGPVERILQVGQPFLDRKGYKCVRVGGREYKVHRLVMEQVLGRPLLSHETVHHVNGQRSDNRPENLELWSKSQPAGQRVTDKVAWAVELLELYAPELLAAKPVQLRLA